MFEATSLHRDDARLYLRFPDSEPVPKISMDTTKLPHKLGKRVDPSPTEEDLRLSPTRSGRPAPEASIVLEAVGPVRRGDTGPVGFDPRRPHRRRPSDLAFIAAAILVTVVAVGWALFG